ncbi:MAG TPA: DEAD/DEAH box helicase family protein [Acidobacteriaceae bacterium]|nr:DEAD/DEAH box helicase family protein [Acidobacteriaceae bacterium]
MSDKANTHGWYSPNVWAETAVHDGNSLRQLLVPESRFTVVTGTAGSLRVANTFGTWAAAAAGSPSPDGADLYVQLPLGSRVGDTLQRARWVGPRLRATPEHVTASFIDALSFAVEGRSDRPGLREPQLGAVHAVLGYWTTGRTTPATVVMPTGTGKTETMLALLVAGQIERLLVLVPSDTLREQVAGKFQRLGVLQELGIVSAHALRPVVGRLTRGFTSPDSAAKFAAACNVIVATPNVLSACSPDSLQGLTGACSHLFVDEAHHVPARTWTGVREQFANKRVVQFTATPFREDGRHLAGQLIYAFPLRKAQEQNYFSRINYTSVIDFDDVDRSVATKAVAQLKADLAAGYDHLLMARVDGIPRAKQILPLYEELAKKLHPVIINSQMSKRDQRAALQAVRDRTSRIIICVNMLGEGFDLPSLKVAAIHDPRKSLSVTLQLIGRFARTSSTVKLGAASAFVARRDVAVDRNLRALYAENSDWNYVLRDLTEAAVEEQQNVSDFEAGFTSLPEEINIRSLLPKMSTVVYRTPTSEWDPFAMVDHFGEDNLLTDPIGLNNEAGVAWCVVEHRGSVRWGDVRTVEEVTYELFVLYFDVQRRLLYINSSANSGVFEELAEAVVGAGAIRFTGSTVYRVMADVQLLTPTTVGALDIRSQFKRFSMHVGSDVTQGISAAETQNKVQTNISGNGYREGERVNISASLKGRIWSHAAAYSLKHWCDWCDEVGTKLLDDSISIDDVIGNFLVPEEIQTRPSAVLLGIEWPWEIYLQSADRLQLRRGPSSYALVDVDLRPADEADSGPLRFLLRTPAWTATYEADYERGRLRFRCTDAAEVELIAGRAEPQPLSSWLNVVGLTFLLAGDQLIDSHGLLYRQDYNREAFPRERLTALDWAGVNLQIESQGPEQRPDSIQARAISQLRQETDWDIIVDDDGSGEVADVVALRIMDNTLVVKLVHCKYSHDSQPGARLSDLYEVCGQANRSANWRTTDVSNFFNYLGRRARRRIDRTNVSPFIVGDGATFYRLQERAIVMKRRMEVVIAQPGLSAASATEGQLLLLAASEAYLRAKADAPLQVWCSP